MSAGRRGVALTPMDTREDIIVRTAELADDLGYEAFALPEAWALDSTVVLARIAGRTAGSPWSPGSCRCGAGPRPPSR